MAKDVKDIKHMVQKDVDNHRLDKVIARLPFAKGATFDSSDEGINPRCHIKTRIELRHQIQSWAEDQQVKCFFWLKGMAGTGKSTISRTMADWLSKENKLGASFFFKRGEADRDSSAKLFTTICAQLLINIPALISPVELAIDTDPYISEKSMGEQFEKLICQPLSQIQNASKLILLFDALDECTQGETFLRLLSQTKDKWSPNLQIMITSRPEKAIRLGFKDVEEEIRKDIELYDMPRPIVERDITFFLEDEFAKIRKKYEKDGQKLPLTWPGKEILRDLVSMAVPLFIVAATICRFIEDEVWSDPAGQLKKVLDYHNRDPDTDSHIERLDATYSPILNQLIVGRTKKAQKPLIDRFRKIVGPIIHLAEPLSRSSLASLLDIDSQQIESQLSSLHSVFSVPSSAESPIRMLHLSFRDFLVDADRSETDLFWINEKETHHMIVIKCLDRMSRYEHFRDNICGLEHYGILRSDIERGLIDKCLPADLQYASIFWVSHFEQSEMGISDNDIIHGFLKTNFLHWLEALSLLGRISESIDLIHRLRSIVVGISKPRIL